MKAQPAVLALFDLDHTLLTVDCDEIWVEFLIEQGAVDRATFEAGNRVIGEKYRRGEVGLLEFTEFYLSTLADHPVDRLESWREAYLRAKILPAIPVDSRRLVARHVDDGHLCVMTTAASRFLAAPIARGIRFRACNRHRTGDARRALYRQGCGDSEHARGQDRPTGDVARGPQTASRRLSAELVLQRLAQRHSAVVEGHPSGGRQSGPDACGPRRRASAGRCCKSGRIRAFSRE